MVIIVALSSPQCIRVPSVNFVSTLCGNPFGLVEYAGTVRNRCMSSERTSVIHCERFALSLKNVFIINTGKCGAECLVIAIMDPLSTQ